MADDLGRAELKIVVDDSQAKTQLGALKTAIEGFNPQFKGVNRQLFAVADSAEKAKLKVQSLNQVLSQGPGASYGKISAQISRLSSESRNLQIASEAYLKTLTRISELEFVRNARAGRQRATADFEAVRGATLTRGFGAAERLPSLPPTIAGDVQRIRELNFQLRNLEVGSTAFEITQRRLESTQRRVAEATDRVTRAIRSQTAAQREGFGAFSRSISEPSFLAGTPDTGAISKSIERNRVKAAQLAERRNAQLDALDADLARIREQRNAAERRALQIGAARQRRGLVQGGVQRLLGEPLPVPPLPRGFFPGRIQAAQRRRQDITSNALIGGAFPLLFGQGIGASLGGAAGGGLGGAVGGQFGFGLSLLGTAVGAQFDAIIQKATLLGQALDNPIKNFAALQEGALLSSRGLERQVESLIAVGREAEAAALIQQDLAQTYSASTRSFIESARLQEQRANRSFTASTAGVGALTQFIGAELGVAFRRIFEPGFGIAQGRPITAQEPGISQQSKELTKFERDRAALLSAQFRQITAQVQGYKELSLQAEREISLRQEAIDIENLRARRAGAPEIEERQQKGTLERFRIEEQIGQVQKEAAAQAQKDAEAAAKKEQDRAQAARETAAAYQLISAEAQLQFRAIEQQIRDAQSLGAAPAGPVRETLRARQQIASEITAARDRVLQLGAEIDAARLTGDETGAARLVAQQQIAAKGVELSLTTGATALRDAAQQLRDSALETQRSLENLRGGNLEFLNPRDQQALLESLRAQAAPEAFRRGITLRRGGGIESEVNLLNRFLNFSRSESQLLEQGTQLAAAQEIANRPLLISNETLGTNLNALTTSVNNLSAKDWSVQVNVNGTSGATVIGDVAGALI